MSVVKLAKDLRFIELSGKDNRGLSFVSWLDNNIRLVWRD